MISKLPRWVWAGAWSLSFLAGMINVAGLLGFERQAITHLTGTTSMLSAALANREGAKAFYLLAVIGAFLAGCAVSGFFVKDSTLKLGRNYGIALRLESMLLVVSMPLLNSGSFSGIYAVSCACGLQNAMVSTYSGFFVRTTHLSGMFTDRWIFSVANWANFHIMSSDCGWVW